MCATPLELQTNVGLANPKLVRGFAELGGEVVARSPADFGRLIADETAKWAT